MRITRVETFAVPPRRLFCRIETDDGVVGWGEPVVEGRAADVRTAVHELAEYLVGQDPMRIEDHWQAMTKSTFYRGGPILSSAVAGIDQALWDIAGKTLDVPVHVLLGGPVRDRVQGHINRPAGPGLGIEVDERAARRANGTVPDWRGPLWRHADGSFAEW